MKFLIIDDCKYKVENIKEYFKDHELDISKSYNSGMRKLVSERYDGIILDMQFPTFDEEMWNIDTEQGVHVLVELERRKIEIPVVVYSSSRKDVSAYKNVKSYIVSDSNYVKDKVLRFIELCSENNQKNTN